VWCWRVMTPVRLVALGWWPAVTVFVHAAFRVGQVRSDERQGLKGAAAGDRSGVYEVRLASARGR
jgi:hypothetical protein